MKKLGAFVFAVLGLVAVTPCFAASAKLVDIQSAEKTTIMGAAFTEGAGTRAVKAIEVKFKINKKGVVEVPILTAYLYDRNKNLVTKITNFLLKQGTSYSYGQGKFFKGKKTQQIGFFYPNEIRFKYFLVVLGAPGNLTTKLSPRGANIEEFAYDEKSQAAP